MKWLNHHNIFCLFNAKEQRQRHLLVYKCKSSEFNMLSVNNNSQLSSLPFFYLSLSPRKSCVSHPNKRREREINKKQRTTTIAEKDRSFETTQKAWKWKWLLNSERLKKKNIFIGPYNSQATRTASETFGSFPFFSIFSKKTKKQREREREKDRGKWSKPEKKNTCLIIFLFVFFCFFSTLRLKKNYSIKF